MKEELNYLLIHDANGFLIRSRFTNNACSENASIFHANKELRNAKKNSLTKLNVEGVEETDNSVIEN